MRNSFVHTLLALAKKDQRIMLLTGDLGYEVFEKFQNQLPRQYINCGVAEQNMTGVAAGLAIEGYTPVIYSIVPFVTMRNFEQIRNDVCYQNLNVKIVGVGAGFSYGPYGHTHHGLEDIGILRTLPNLILVVPGDPIEVAWATRAMMDHKGPVYLRLGRAGEPTLHTKKRVFRIGKGMVMREGSDVTIIATSTMLETAMRTAGAISGSQKSRNCIGGVRIISMPTIKPLDTKIILDSMKKTKAIVTLEEHSIIGGLGSAVAEVIAEHGAGIPFRRIGVPDRFTKTIGGTKHMREANGLSPSQVIKTITRLLQ